MNKRHLHHIWIRLRPISYWYFLALAVVSIGVAVYALRQNNYTMIRLREAVFQADEANGDVETALRELREFIYSHMNTNLSSGQYAVQPPIQLKYRYERLVQAEKDQVRVQNEAIYATAQTACEQRFPAGQLANGRVQCIQEYVSQNGVSEQTIPDSLYKFDFVSAAWSPDLAGWSLVLAGIFSTLFAVRFGMERWLQFELRP